MYVILGNVTVVSVDGPGFERTSQERLSRNSLRQGAGSLDRQQQQDVSKVSAQGFLKHTVEPPIKITYLLICIEIPSLF